MGNIREGVDELKALGISIQNMFLIIILMYWKRSLINMMTEIIS